MKIEFQLAGNGANVEVLLIDTLDAGWPPAEAVVDRFYTSEHQGEFCFGEDLGVPIEARLLFEAIEDSWAKPVIGGRYSQHHPYWHERAEKRNLRGTQHEH